MINALIVDDDADLMRALALRLKSSGIATITANNADTGSEFAIRKRPDVIILDIDMPSFTGLELHECLLLSERTRNIPVIYLSGRDSSENRLAAYQQGAAAFVSKPFDWKSLIETIQRVVAIAT